MASFGTPFLSLPKRLAALMPIFPASLPCKSSASRRKDDLLDSAVAAWTALRISNGEARRVREPEQDEKGLETTIRY
jgi:predicted RNase H-like nuclease